MPRSRKKAPAGRKTRSKKSQKQDVHPDDDGGWYTIKGIVDERLGNRRRVEYLVEWDDNPETGEKYPASWVRMPVNYPVARVVANLSLTEL